MALEATTLYRLWAGTIKSAVLRVPVAPHEAALRRAGRACAGAPGGSGGRRGVHPGRSPGREAVVPRRDSRVRLLARPAAGPRPVRVAVIDSGLEVDHPEFTGQVALAQSFVGGAITDRQATGLRRRDHRRGSRQQPGDRRHRVSGGAAGRKGRQVGRHDRAAGRGEGDPLGGRQRRARDQPLARRAARPARPPPDTYSEAEQSAIAYAYSKGAVVVAAVGNGDEAPKTPWPYASYPAALPHVLGVSALTADGSVPVFSIRDKVFNDIAAPASGSSRRSARSDCEPPDLPRPGLLAVRAARVPQRGRHVLRRRPGVGRAQLADRRASVAGPGSGDSAARALGVDVTPATGCTRASCGRD